MLSMFNEQLHKAPEFETEKNWGDFIAFPFNVIVNWPMGAPAGVALFTHYKVNVS